MRPDGCGAATELEFIVPFREPVAGMPFGADIPGQFCGDGLIIGAPAFMAPECVRSCIMLTPVVGAATLFPGPQLLEFGML